MGSLDKHSKQEDVKSLLKELVLSLREEARREATADEPADAVVDRLVRSAGALSRESESVPDDIMEDVIIAVANGNVHENVKRLLEESPAARLRLLALLREAQSLSDDTLREKFDSFPESAVPDSKHIPVSTGVPAKLSKPVLDLVNKVAATFTQGSRN